MKNKQLPDRLTAKALGLTLAYVLLWLAGPLLLEEAGQFWGLPLWFWFSCLMAPFGLVLAAYMMLLRRR